MLKKTMDQKRKEMYEMIYEHHEFIDKRKKW